MFRTASTSQLVPLEPAVTLPATAGHGVEHVVQTPQSGVQLASATVLAAEGAAGHDTGTELGLMALAIAIAVGGLLLAFLVYSRAGTAERLAGTFGPLYRLVRNMYWVDEFYELVILRPFYAISRGFAKFDRWVVDGLVNATGVTAEIGGQVIKLFQTGLVRNYALMFLFGVFVILYYVIRAV